MFSELLNVTESLFFTDLPMKRVMGKINQKSRSRPSIFKSFQNVSKLNFIKKWIILVKISLIFAECNGQPSINGPGEKTFTISFMKEFIIKIALLKTQY